MSKTIKDWVPETKSLLKALTDAGFKLVSGDNGEDVFTPGNLAGFLDNLLACDEAHLFVESPEGKRRWLYLVLGNDPGELVCDYVCDDGLDKVAEAHYAKWEGHKQPTTAREDAKDTKI